MAMVQALIEYVDSSTNFHQDHEDGFVDHSDGGEYTDFADYSDVTHGDCW